MFRFLVVEDEERTLHSIKSLLSEEFDGASIDAAGSVAEGSRHLANSIESGLIYDAVLLDFKLPSSLGENPEIDNSLREEVRRRHPRTLVVHMTAFTQDPYVVNHLMAGYKELGSSQPLLISKRDVAWPSLLCAKLRTFLFSREVSQQLTELFGAGSSIDSPPYQGKKSLKGGITHRLAKLTQDIEHHWKDLDRDLQQRICDIFVVDASGDNVRIGLL